VSIPLSTGEISSPASADAASDPSSDAHIFRCQPDPCASRFLLKRSRVSLQRFRRAIPCFLLVCVGGFLRAETLKVGFEIGNEPVSFIDSNGHPAGFAVDLANAVAAEAGIRVEPVIGPWETVFTDFKNGKIDLIASLVYSKDRDRFIDFSVAHLSVEGAVFLRKDDKSVHALNDLRSRRIATPPGGFTQEYLTSHGLGGHLFFVPTLADALEALDAGECDAVAATDIIGRHVVKTRGLKNVRKSGIVVPGFSYRLHMGVLAGQSDRLASINEGLARIHANGTYDRLYEKWIGPIDPKPVTFAVLAPYLAPAGLLIAAIAGVFWWQRILLKRIARHAAALRESEQRLTRVLEGSEDGFWDWDLRTGRIERSQCWARMLGYDLAEIDPTLEGGLILLHPDDRPAHDAYRHQLFAGTGTRHDIEYRMKSKTGEWRWMLERGKVVTIDSDGAPLRVAGTRSDITDLKNAREELVRQEALFRFIYQHAPVGISWLRRGQADTRLVNSTHERITGVPASHSRISANYVAATHPDDRERQRVFQEKIDRGEIDNFSMEKRYVHPDGAIVWALLTLHRYHDPVSHEAQTVTTLVDISGVKKAGEEREQLHLKILESQKIESLGLLASGIAHDFNNLLTVVLANASLLRLDARASSEREPLTQIENAARRASDLCRQMLAYAGKGRVQIESVDLEQLVQDTAQLLQISISKKARLVLHLAGGLPAVEADATQLRQIVMNLVINASDALGESPGDIRIQTSFDLPRPGPGTVVHAFDTRPGNCVCLEISDTGLGMDAATTARMFDPFFTSKRAGRGLGLAAVLGIVRTHRGTLTVDSLPGSGTTFRLYLAPRSAPATPPQELPASRG